MKHNPYIGPRPYERQDRHNFFGRTREARDLRSLIIAERTVLFYAPSGAGKTSLLNAQVIPDLEEEGFNVLPLARVGSEVPETFDRDSIANVFIFSVLQTLAQTHVPASQLASYTLTSFLGDYNWLFEQSQVIPEALAPQRYISEQPFTTHPPLLILDQFEELFTTHRDRWHDAEGFFKQIRQALRALPSLGVLFTMREDYVAEVDAYTHLLPRRLRARFRMGPLGHKGALEAIKQPAENQGLHFERGVPEWLVDNLRRVNVRRLSPTGTIQETDILGPTVEPVQLQVVCYQLWQNLPEQEDQIIRQEEAEKYGDVNQALINFYEHALSTATVAASERKTRRWFGEQLITPMQTRGLALRGVDHTGGLPNAAVDILENEHIVRAEIRGGARWYELAHDRLIEPVLHANRAWEAARETPLRVTARKWAQAQADPTQTSMSVLYRGQELRDAWQEYETKAQKDEAEPYEQAFLDASQHAADKRAEREQLEAAKRKRKRRLLTVSATIGIITFTIVSFLAWLAINASQLAYSLQQATQARYLRPIDQDSSIESALISAAAEDEGFFEVFEALTQEARQTSEEAALRQVLLDAYPITFAQEIEDYVENLAYSPNSTQLYIGMSRAGTWVWDYTTQVSSTIPPPGPEAQGAVRDLDFALDQPLLAVAGDDGISRGVVSLWDTEATTWRAHLQAPMPEEVYDEVYGVAFSPDGRYLATGGDYGPHWRDRTSQDTGLVRIWELKHDTDMDATLVLTLTEHQGRVNAVAFGPPKIGTAGQEGYLLATASDDETVCIWHIKPREPGPPGTTLITTLEGHTGGVYDVIFNPTDAWVVSASEDRTIRVWDPQTGLAQATLTGHTAEVTSLDFDTSGQYLLSGSRDRTARVWDMQARNTKAIIVLTGPSNLVQSVSFSMEDKFIAAGSGDQMVRIWNRDYLREVQLSTLTGHIARVRDIAFDPEGTLLASGDDNGTVHIWDLEQGEILYTLPNGDLTIWSLAFSPDGQTLVTCSKDHLVRVWDIAAGRLLKTLKGHHNEVNAVTFSPDGRFMVTGADNQTALVWNTSRWEIEAVLTLHGNPGAIYAVDYSPDGQWVATGHTDHNIRLWEADITGDEWSTNRIWILHQHENDIYDLDFSANSQVLASASWDGYVHFWDMETFTLTGESLYHGENFVYSVAFSPDMRYLATGARDAKVRLWELDDRFPKRPPTYIGELDAHTDIVWDIAFSPDGRRLASSSWDRTIRRYPVTFEDVLTLAEAYLQ